MNIKNYTSNVPIERTVARIEQVLAEAGANGIAKSYKGGAVVALSFRIKLPAGRDVEIQLPANVEAVYGALAGAVRRPRYGTLTRLREQAGRTAWALMRDWVEVQVSLIQMGQAEFMQVFLPYVWDGKRTFYTALKETNYAALLPERSASAG
jgi:hypothetical protein